MVEERRRGSVSAVAAVHKRCQQASIVRRHFLLAGSISMMAKVFVRNPENRQRL